MTVMTQIPGLHWFPRFVADSGRLLSIFEPQKKRKILAAHGWMSGRP